MRSSNNDLSLMCVVSRKRHPEFDAVQAVFVEACENDNVRAQRIECGDGEAELYCHSGRKQQKEQGIISRFSARFEQEFDRLADKWNVKLFFYSPLH